MLGWIALGVVTAMVATSIVGKLLMRGNVRDDEYITVDNEDVMVLSWFGSKLPKFLGHMATTIGLTICYRAYPKSYGIRVSGVPEVSARLAANEVFHIVDRVRRGFIGYWKRILWQTAQHPFNHDARPYEQESTAAQPLILNGTYPGVDASNYLAIFK